MNDVLNDNSLRSSGDPVATYPYAARAIQSAQGGSRASGRGRRPAPSGRTVVAIEHPRRGGDADPATSSRHGNGVVCYGRRQDEASTQGVEALPDGIRHQPVPARRACVRLRSSGRRWAPNRTTRRHRRARPPRSVAGRRPYSSHPTQTLVKSSRFSMRSIRLSRRSSRP